MGTDFSFNPLQYPLLWQRPNHITNKDTSHENLFLMFFMISVLRPHVSVELGTANEDTYFSICQGVDFLRLPTKCYAVGQWDQNTFQQVNSYNRVFYQSFSSLLNMQTDQALSEFEEESIDFLHIKGLPSVDVVNMLREWLPKLSNRGIILLSEPKVSSSEFSSLEVFNLSSMGMQLFVKGKGIPEEIHSFLSDRVSYDRYAEIFKFLADKTMASRTEIECSIIIPQYGHSEFTINCVVMLYKHVMPYHRAEIIVVDDCSPDDSRQKVQQSLGNAVVMVNNLENGGFSVSCNNGAAAAKGKYVVFLNNDVSFEKDWLSPMLKVASDPLVGIVGAKLVYPNGLIQHAGLYFVNDGFAPVDIRMMYEGLDKNAPQAKNSSLVPAVMGACLLIEKELYWSVGGFDEGFKMSYEDIDLCLKVRNFGKGIWYESQAELTHFASQTRKEMIHSPQDRANLQRLNQKWADKINIPVQLKGKEPDKESIETITVVINECENLLEFYTMFKNCIQILCKGDKIILRECEIPGIKEFSRSVAKNNPDIIHLLPIDIKEDNNLIESLNEIGIYNKIIYYNNVSIDNSEFAMKLDYVLRFGNNDTVYYVD